MVRRSVKSIIVYINVTGRVKKLDLVFISQTGEQFHCFFRPHLMPSERHVGFDDFMHPCCDSSKIFLRNMGRVAFYDIAVVTFRNRSSQYNATVREHILCCLA